MNAPFPLKIEIEGKTKDTNDDVFKATLYDSRLHGCVHKKGINVWVVSCRRRGDFKRLMNGVVKHFGKNKICFTMVINDNLKNTLRGFKERKVWFEPLEEYMTILEGVWNSLKTE